jgi:ABC-type spermidine/putrescine transport system permease subunit II
MRRRVHPFIALIGGATISFLYLPLLAITVWSFNDSRGLAWQGATVSWYGHLVADFPDSRIDRSAPCWRWACAAAGRTGLDVGSRRQ